MEDSLNLKKHRIIKRLENSIEMSNNILYEINQELSQMIDDNKQLVKTALVYDKWISKGK
ncbi:hypothetical protein ENBRE01_0353 [Enteropsectra breve]|nr:hypothetical protein ENBRE01_0353 [Enteropsectra breve]